MNLKIQVILIIATIVAFYCLIRSVKKGKLRTDYALVWILSSICLIIVSVFPQIIYFISSILGIQSPANVVFLLIILLLIIVVYNLFNKVSVLEERVKNLIHEVAFLEKDIKDKEKNKESN